MNNQHVIRFLEYKLEQLGEVNSSASEDLNIDIAEGRACRDLGLPGPL